MNLPDGREPVDSVGHVITHVRNRGVSLWVENGELHYRAAKGALKAEEIARLGSSRNEIVALLQYEAANEAYERKSSSRQPARRYPLTFSQSSHWRRYRLGENQHIRQIVSATRIGGELDIDAVRRSVAEMARRHEALRTEIVVIDQIPYQEIGESRVCEFRYRDLTALQEAHHEEEVRRLLEECILEKIDVTVDPLSCVSVIRLSSNLHVLIVLMEHLISDMYSMSVFLRDLFVAYRQAQEGNGFSWSGVPVQFADYAAWQTLEYPQWLERHGQYWAARTAGCERVGFPESKGFAEGKSSGWGTVPLRIGRELTANLIAQCRAAQTTLAIGVFAAYVGVVLRWCDVSDAVVRYVTDGRVSHKLKNSVGFFAFILHLRVTLLETDRFVELMSRVREEYCTAYEHADFGYIEAQEPQPDFVRNAGFNWIPRGVASGASGQDETLTYSPLPFENPMLEHPMLHTLEKDAEPTVMLFEGDDEITGSVYFPRNRFSVADMEQFARHFQAFVGALARQPNARVKDVLIT